MRTPARCVFISTGRTVGQSVVMEAIDSLTSCQVMPSFRLATLANSFRIWTLITQRRASKALAAAARRSVVKAYTRTFVSRNSTGICFVAIELPVRRQRLTDGRDVFQRAFAASFPVYI